jgi:hypothetical protein
MSDTQTYCCWPKCKGQGLDLSSEGSFTKASDCRCLNAVWANLERELIDLAKTVQGEARA